MNKINGSINKQIEKKASSCMLCGQSEYHTLNVHRIIPGCEGGKYTKLNIVVVCANCHGKIHAEQIEIIGWLDSTAGLVLCWKDEEGKEHMYKKNGENL